MTLATPRPVCSRCRRPSVVCYCAHLVPLPTRTRVVFLQHPREAKVAIGTARMSHLMLVNSELHQGVLFAAHPRVQELAADPRAALLFPGEGAQDPAGLSEGAAQTLVVIDGTWAQARKVLKVNPILQRLPRIGLAPTQAGNYRIRREPAAECLATVEAVAQALGALEGDPRRLSGMLAAFTFMVDRQIELAAARTEPRRYRLWTTRQAQAAARLRRQLARAVVVSGEVNAHVRGRIPGRPELLHLCALRVATGERFQMVATPRRPLAPAAAYHLGLEEAQIRGGEPITALLQRWAEFLRPGDVLCGWRHFTRDQLAREGAESAQSSDMKAHEWLDLRVQAARWLQASPGAPEQAAQLLGRPVTEPVAAGRTGQTVAVLGQIVEALRELEGRNELAFLE